MENKEKCPFCNKYDAAEIIYGTPVFDDINDWEKVKNGEIVLGGECLPYPKPKYHCRYCNMDFGNYTVV